MGEKKRIVFIGYLILIVSLLILLLTILMAFGLPDPLTPSCRTKPDYVYDTTAFVFAIVGFVYGLTVNLFMGSRKTIYSGVALVTVAALAVVLYWYLNPNAFTDAPAIHYIGTGFAAIFRCASEDPRTKLITSFAMILPSFITGFASVGLGVLSMNLVQKMR